MSSTEHKDQDASADPKGPVPELVTDGFDRGRYDDCPNCGADEAMGYVYRSGFIAVQCYFCGCRGPEYAAASLPNRGADKLAFVGWNAMYR